MKMRNPIFVVKKKDTESIRICKTSGTTYKLSTLPFRNIRKLYSSIFLICQMKRIESLRAKK
jgi:hypothetical protein